MTVTATSTRNDYEVSIASEDTFQYTFRVLATSDVTVYKNNVIVAPADYTVNNIGAVAGGTVVLDTAASLNDTVSIVLTMPVTRDTNYQENGAFLAQDVNGDFDKIYIGAIQNENAIDRTIRLSDAENVPISMVLPLKDQRRGKFLKFHDTTGAVQVADGTSIGAQYTAGSGLALSAGNEFSNTAPDQTVSLTGAGATSVTGTYPSFTITGSDTTYTAGSGLSLTGTEFANTAPDQTVALTGAGTTTISGTYPNFTITSTGGGGDVTLAGNNSFTGLNSFSNTTTFNGEVAANAGISSNNNLLFATGGSEQMRISSAGNVGIGASSPTNPLHLVGLNQVKLRIEGGTGSPSQLFDTISSDSGSPLSCLSYITSSKGDLTFDMDFSNVQANTAAYFKIDQAQRLKVDGTGIDVTGTVEFDGLSGTGTVTVTDILDEDTMVSNSATALATQQSIKAYVDANAGGGGDITAVTAGTGLTGGGTTGAVTLNAAGGIGITANANDNSLDLATSTVRGGIELFSDTDQSVAANAVSSTAGRTYGIQLNSANQAVVNVPWVTGAGGGIALTDLSATTASPGTTGLAYDNTTGVFTYTPAVAITNNNQLTNGAGYTTNTGTVTPSSTDTFTNKSGAISQWTNDSGYTTNVGDITGVTAGDGLSGGGTTGAVTVDVDSTVVRTSGTQTISGQKNFNDVIRINNQSAILRMTGGTSQSATIQFGDVNDFDIGKIAYNNSDNSMSFTTNVGERARITSTGDFLVGKTASNSTVVGCELDSNGSIYSTVEIAALTGGIAIRNNSGADSVTGLRCYDGLADITTSTASGSGHSLSISGGLSGEYARFTSAKRLGIGITAPTQALHVVGDIVATGNITANFSDERLKDFQGTIPNALDKVAQLNGYYYTPNETAQSLGVDNNGLEVGISAQEVEAVLPEIVADSVIGKGYKTVMYERLTPLLIEAVKELTEKVEKLELRLNEMEK